MRCRKKNQLVAACHRIIQIVTYKLMHFFPRKDPEHPGTRNRARRFSYEKTDFETYRYGPYRRNHYGGGG